MDIVNWDALKKGLLIRDSLESTDDLVLVAANTSYNKRGDLYQTYAVPASALGGGGGGGGTLSSVGLTMPGAFTVAGSPLIANGTIAVTMAGLATQYLDGTGALRTLPIYAVSNGLSTVGTTSFKLGGLLLEDTFITTQNNHSLTVSAPNTQNTFPPFGVVTQGNAGVAAFNNFGSGTNITATKFNAGASPVMFLAKSGSAATASDLLIQITKSGANSAGAAVYIEAVVNSSINGGAVASRFITRATNTVAATYTSDLEFWLRVNGAAIARKMNLAGSGQLTLDGYGSATFNGTVRYLLAVDTSGNVQEVTLAGLTNALNDAAAAAAGVPLSGIYRNGSVLQIRAI